MKRTIIFAMCLVLVSALAGCGTNIIGSGDPTADETATDVPANNSNADSDKVGGTFALV